jgi:hypothetical protein
LTVDKNRVLEALETLKAELAGAKDVDPHTRATLEQMVGDIHARLSTDAPATREDEPLSGQLNDVLLGFEAEHPQLTGAINQVAAALANLGI